MADRPDDVTEEVSSSQGQQTHEVAESSRPPQTEEEMFRTQLVAVVSMFTQVMQNPRFIALLQPPPLSQPVGTQKRKTEPAKAQPRVAETPIFQAVPVQPATFQQPIAGSNGQGSNLQAMQQVFPPPSVHPGYFGGGLVFQSMPGHAPGNQFHTPGIVFAGAQTMMPNPMYGRIGMQPGFQSTQGQFGMSQANFGMTGIANQQPNMASPEGAAAQPIPILPPPSLPDPPASPVITPSTSHPVPPIQPPDVSTDHALSDSDSDLDVADAYPEVDSAPPRREKRIPGWLYSTVASSGVTELPVPPLAGLPRRSARLQKRGQSQGATSPRCWGHCKGHRELKTEKNQSITRNYRGWLCSVLVNFWWNLDENSGLLRIPYLQTVLGRVLRRYAAQIHPNRIETAECRPVTYCTKTKVTTLTQLIKVANTGNGLLKGEDCEFNTRVKEGSAKKNSAKKYVLKEAPKVTQEPAKAWIGKATTKPAKGPAKKWKRPFPRKSEEQREVLRSKNKCLNCEEPSHIAQNCPQKKRPANSEDKEDRKGKRPMAGLVPDMVGDKPSSDASELCRAWGKVRDQTVLIFFDPGAKANFISP
ncbi:hypothetical protein L7F22_008415 [Adiantum nelumboides]|nr:hypothetical protein [Adiantum nelumboides]